MGLPISKNRERQVSASSSPKASGPLVAASSTGAHGVDSNDSNDGTTAITFSLNLLAPTATTTLNTTTTTTTTTATSSSDEKHNQLIYSKESLELSIRELVNASNCFAKAGRYKKSNYCERMAKLVALQVALLPEHLRVLQVGQSDLHNLIVSFQAFNDAFIVAEAYECHLAWRQALFKNVILDGHLDYLQDYCKKCDLSAALIKELVLLYKKYINSHQLTLAESNDLAKAMRKLLVKLPNVELKCKLYSQLNLVESKHELMRDAAVEAHLKDLGLA